MPIYEVDAMYDDTEEVDTFLVAALDDPDTIIEAINQIVTRPATVKGWREVTNLYQEDN